MVSLQVEDTSHWGHGNLLSQGLHWPPLHTPLVHTHRVWLCVVVNLPVVLAPSVDAVIQSRLAPLVFARLTADLHTLTCVRDPGGRAPTLSSIDNIFFGNVTATCEEIIILFNSLPHACSLLPS